MTRKDFIQECQTECPEQRPELELPCFGRFLAISAGDYRLAVMREVRRMLAECKDHPLLATKVGIERLISNRLITDKERDALEKICDLVFAAQTGKMKPEEAFAQVRGVYDKMLIDNTTSSVALAIASVASSGSVTAVPHDIEVPRGALASISRSDAVDMGIVGGAVVGAVVGGAIGGAGGAVIGAVIGGIAGGVATACAT